MPWFRIVVWLKLDKTVQVLRGLRAYDRQIDEVRLDVWDKCEGAYPKWEVMRVEVELLPNDSRSLLRYFREEERQRLEVLRKKKGKPD